MNKSIERAIFCIGIFIMFSILSVLFISCASAVVSHSASQVTPGTFASGNYTFPQNAIVNGNVGIGTSSPNYKLVVNQSSGSDAIVIDRAASNKPYSSLVFSDDGIEKWALQQGIGSNDFRIHEDATTTRLVIQDGTGNVGIGTTTPTQKLNVVGDVNVTGNAQFSSDVNITGLLNGLNISSLGSAMPIGAISQWGGTTAPSGYLLCDGSSYSRSAYADLFAIIGTIYGNTSSTTFNVPDFRGIFPKGAGTTDRAAGVDANGNYYSATLGTYLQDKMQGHYHNTNPGLAGGGSRDAYPGGDGYKAFYYTPGFLVTEPITDGTNGNPRTGNTTEPQSLAVNFIIKAYNPTSVNTSGNSYIDGNLTVTGDLSVGGAIGATQSSRLLLTDGDFAVTTDTWANVTGATITLTTGANPVLIIASTVGYLSSAGDYLMLDVNIDGTTRIGGTMGIIYLQQEIGGYEKPLAFTHLTAPLSAGSHTFKLQARRGTGDSDGALAKSSAHPLHFAVIEFK